MPKLLLAIVVVCLWGCAEEVRGAALHAGPPQQELPLKTKQARLEVAIARDRGEWLLKVTLRNTGDVSIIVDRELVMGVGVEVNGRDGSRIKEHFESVPQPATRDEARKRLISLSLGQSVSRTISLKQGWRVLQGGQGVDSQNRTIAVTGYEEIARLPENAQPSSVSVIYGPTWNFSDGFLGYTGLTTEQAQLYLGPLEQTIELVQER